jgi:hypothetical protein
MGGDSVLTLPQSKEASMQKHPFEWLPIKTQTRAFIVLLMLTLVVMGALQILDSHLKTEASPAGIVSFEFAGNLTNAKHILTSWEPRGTIYAGMSLGLDFLFLFSYAGAIGLGCVLASRGLSQRTKTIFLLGAPLAWGQLCAALLDAVENISLIQVLMGVESPLWPALALWCAIPKFIIVAMGLLYLAVSVVLLMIKSPQV